MFVIHDCTSYRLYNYNFMSRNTRTWKFPIILTFKGENIVRKIFHKFREDTLKFRNTKIKLCKVWSKFIIESLKIE